MCTYVLMCEYDNDIIPTRLDIHGFVGDTVPEIYSHFLSVEVLWFV